MIQKFKDFTATLKKKVELEKILTDATCNNYWNISHQRLQVLADYTYSDKESGVIMKELWKKLNSKAKEWRRIQNTLSTLEFLIKNGAPRVIQEIKLDMHRIRSLTTFSYYEAGQDKAPGVREKAEQIADILSDPAKLEEERQGSRKNRMKIYGMSSQKTDKGDGIGGAWAGDNYSGGPIGGFGSSGVGSSSSYTKKNRDYDDWRNKQQSGYQGPGGMGSLDKYAYGASRKESGYDPYVKKSDGMARYEEKRKEETVNRDKAAQDRREIFGGIAGAKKITPGFVNRKQKINENFDSDDDYQVESHEEAKPKRREVKQAPASNLLNMDEDPKPAAPVEQPQGSLFSNMTVSQPVQNPVQPAQQGFSFVQPTQQVAPSFPTTQVPVQQPMTQSVQQPMTQGFAPQFSAQFSVPSTQPVDNSQQGGFALFSGMTMAGQQATTSNPAPPQPQNSMFSFMNTAQEKPQQHTINNNTNLIINMNVNHQSNQTPGTSFAPPKQEEPVAADFGEFNSGVEQHSIVTKEESPKKKNDAWELGSKLFNLDNLNEQKEDKNEILDRGFGPILGNQEQIGNNLLHTKGEDLNMLWNAPMMNQPNTYNQMPHSSYSGGIMGGPVGGSMGAQSYHHPGGFNSAPGGFMQQSHQPTGFNFMHSQQQPGFPQQSGFPFANQPQGSMMQSQPQSGFNFMQGQQPRFM